MPQNFKPGCARPTSTVKKPKMEVIKENKEEKNMIKVGKPAPDFELAGYYKGEFKQFNLSEFKGKWVLLCFYPGDFTFV